MSFNGALDNELLAKVSPNARIIAASPDLYLLALGIAYIGDSQMGTAFELPRLVAEARYVLAKYKLEREGIGIDHAAIRDDSLVAAGREPEGDDCEPPDHRCQCCECEEEAVGYSEGVPYCAAHYRSRG